MDKVEQKGVYMVSKFQMWCFDLDGTLLDQSTRYLAVHKDIIIQMGGEPVFNYCEKRRSGISEANLYKSTGAPLNKLKDYDFQREQLLESRSYLELDTLFPETIQILKRIKAIDTKIWIVTHRGYPKKLSEQLSALGLTELVTGWNNTKGEPDGSIMEMSDQGEQVAAKTKARILSEFKRQFSTVMVGDSPSDIRAAHQAGIQSIALSTGLYSKLSLQKERPTYIFESLEELALNLFD